MNTAAFPYLNPKHLLIGLAMLLAAGLAVALTPRAKIADHGARIDLETMIPKQFGDWRVDESIVPVQVSPDVQAKLDKIYNQVIARTYINDRGERVMLSIAYGADQSDSMAVHKPEVCYPAQGFEIISMQKGTLDVAGGPQLPVVRLVAQHHNRIEPITYWISVGGHLVTGGIDRKLAQMKFTLTGSIPDGLLFRISNIDPDADRAYQLHTKYVEQLFHALSEEGRKMLFGSSVNNN